MRRWSSLPPPSDAPPLTALAIDRINRRLDELQNLVETVSVQTVTVQDEAVPRGGAIRVFNFAGAGVTVTVQGDTATITIP